MKKLLLILLFVSGLVFFGCSKEENSFVSPVIQDKPAAEKPAWVKAAEAQGLQLIVLPPNLEKSLEKSSETSQYVRYDKLTNIFISDMYRSDKRMVILLASLTIRPYSLERSQWVSMGFADEILGGNVSLDPVHMDFGPEDTYFQKPALLNLVATGLDLSGLNQTDEVRLASFDGSEWIPVPAAKISFNVKTGFLQCINGELSHFSRYGFVK